MDPTVIVAAITVVGVIISALASMTSVILTKRGNTVGEQVNDAVNHRHKRKDSEGNVPLRLYDLAIENHIAVKKVTMDVSELGDKVDSLQIVTDQLKTRPPCNYHDGGSVSE